jgi:hypothetical protein
VCAIIWNNNKFIGTQHLVSMGLGFKGLKVVLVYKVELEYIPSIGMNTYEWGI